MRPKGRLCSVDRAIAALARVQHGVVARVQLLDLGVHPRAIGRRLDLGRLHDIHRGVYAVGHTRLPVEGPWMAAVLACESGAVLSHRSAAALHGIRPYSGMPEVTVRPGSKARDGIRIRRAILEPDEITVSRGIPVTTVARSLLDLGAALQGHQVESAIRSADYMGLFDLDDVLVLVDRHPRRRGTAAIRAAVRAAAETRGITRSELEDLFVSRLLKAKLGPPELNGTVELKTITIEADAVWRDHGLIVELDSRAAHDTIAAFETDRERDRQAALAGWLVVRVTWRQLHADSRRVMRDLQQLLDARAPRNGS